MTGCRRTEQVFTMEKIIKKAVFPVAGLGTRFLPATKANPKEMLTVVDKPLIQYAAEEAVNAGIEELIFVTSSSKRAIEDHFDKNYELESELEKKGKTELLRIVQEVVPANVTCVYVRQPEALGLGHAVLCAKPVVGDEPFAVILADDLINCGGNCVLGQMASVYNDQHASILGVEEVPVDETDKYGIVDPGETDGRISQVRSIVEKPAPEDARSNLAVVGRYILTPAIFKCSRMPSKSCLPKSGCLPIALPASVTIAAASWDTCRRRSSLPWSTPSYARPFLNT